MSSAFNPRKKAHYILTITLFCLLGTISSFLVLSSNLRSHSDLPASIGIANEAGKIEYYEVVAPNDTLTSTLSETVTSDNSVVIESSDTIFNSNPAFLIYMMLIVILISIVSGSVPIFLGSSYQLTKEYNLSWKTIALVSLFSLFIVVFAYILNTRGVGLYMPRFFIDDLKVLFYNGWIADFVVLAVIGLQLPILVNMFLSGPAADKVKVSSFSKSNVEEAAKKLEGIEESLRRGLKVMTVLVVISVFSAEAFRLATIHEVSIIGIDILPSEIDYLYGLSFSFTLALVYVPSHIYLNFKREKLMKYAEEQIEETKEENKAWFEGLLKSLTTQKSAMETVKLTLMLMSPVISSILPSHFEM